MSRNTIWDGLYNQLDKVTDFDKKLELFFPKIPIYFSKKIHSLKLLKIFKQKYHLRPILWKYCQYRPFSKRLSSFSKLPIYFPGNLKLLNVFSSIEQWCFLKGSLRKVSVFSVFENFQVFFRKKSISFCRKSNVLTSSDHMSKSEFPDAFGKKNCEVERFRKSSKRFFFKISIYFSKEGQELKVLRVLGQ